MKGEIKTWQKCPVCAKSFTEVPEKGLVCEIHQTRPTRYYIDVYHKGRLKISRDKTGGKILSYEEAFRIREAIRYEIDRHSFDPANYSYKVAKPYQFQEWADKWLSLRQEEGLSPGWLNKLSQYVLYFKKYFGGDDVRDIKTFQLKDFYRSMKGLSDNTKYDRMSQLKKLFVDAKERGYITEVPEFPKLKRKEKTDWKWIREEWIRDFVLSFIPPKHIPIMKFQCKHIIRPSETRALMWDCLTPDCRIAKIKRSFSNGVLRETTKEDNVWTLPVHSEVAEILRRQPRRIGKNSEFVFLCNGNPYGEGRMRKIWNKARDLAIQKRPDFKEQLEGIKFYEASRHTTASLAYTRGVPISHIEKVGGWKPGSKAAARYRHIDTESLRYVVEPEAQNR